MAKILSKEELKEQFIQSVLKIKTTGAPKEELLKFVDDNIEEMYADYINLHTEEEKSIIYEFILKIYDGEITDDEIDDLTKDGIIKFIKKRILRPILEYAKKQKYNKYKIIFYFLLLTWFSIPTCEKVTRIAKESSYSAHRLISRSFKFMTMDYGSHNIKELEQLFFQDEKKEKADTLLFVIDPSKLDTATFYKLKKMGKLYQQK